MTSSDIVDNLNDIISHLQELKGKVIFDNLTEKEVIEGITKSSMDLAYLSQEVEDTYKSYAGVV